MRYRTLSAHEFPMKLALWLTDERLTFSFFFLNQYFDYGCYKIHKVYTLPRGIEIILGVPDASINLCEENIQINRGVIPVSTNNHTLAKSKSIWWGLTVSLP